MAKFEVTWNYRSFTANYDGVKEIQTNYTKERDVKAIAKVRISKQLCTSPIMINITGIKRILTEREN